MMGLRFRKNFALNKLVKLNLSKSGVSLSVGQKGFTANIGRNGLRGTIGAPGTGLSYSSYDSYNDLTSDKKMPDKGFFIRHRTMIMIVVIIAVLAIGILSGS